MKSCLHSNERFQNDSETGYKPVLLQTPVPMTSFVSAYNLVLLKTRQRLNVTASANFFMYQVSLP